MLWALVQGLVQQLEGNAAYEEQEPTPENSMEIVKEIADEFDESPNGVRMILSKAGVYVKKTPAASGSGTSSGGGSGGSRVSKAAAQEALVAVLTDVGAEIDNDIVGKWRKKQSWYINHCVVLLVLELLVAIHQSHLCG